MKSLVSHVTLLLLSLVSRSRAQCTNSQFVCANGKCIRDSYQCDRFNHCDDNSDETNCICHTGDIRLTGVSSNSSQGNVELCVSNKYNAICENYWSSNDAKVACKQLGFNNSAKATSFGPTTTLSQWINIAGGCNGSETTLYYCPRGPTAPTCNSNNPAAVVCSTPYCPSTDFRCNNGHCINALFQCDGYDDCKDYSDENNCICTRGMVRLEGGPTPAEGTVGMCAGNEWGQVCDTYWTSAEAQVVCKQLGYKYGSALLGSHYGQGSAQSYWSDVGGCRGSENILTACRFTTPASCLKTHYAGASCQSNNPQSTPSTAVIGGAVGGGIGVLIVVGIIVVSTCCLCNLSRRKKAATNNDIRLTQINTQTAPPTPLHGSTSGGTKIIIIQQENRGQPVMPPMNSPAAVQCDHYPSYVYTGEPVEPHFVHPQYTATDGTSNYYSQSYTDPYSYAPPEMPYSNNNNGASYGAPTATGTSTTAARVRVPLYPPRGPSSARAFAPSNVPLH